VFWVAITEDYRKSGVGTRETGSLSFNGEYSCLVLSMLAGRQQFRRDPHNGWLRKCARREPPRECCIVARITARSRRPHPPSNWSLSKSG
jgi:hypothetical protein